MGVAHDYQIGFQTPVTPIAEGIFLFHDDLIVFLAGILIFVRYILVVCLQRFGYSNESKPKTQRLIHAPFLEIV
jgi:heme/copper-type cytochrome/quinol oxidase subunit 2